MDRFLYIKLIQQQLKPHIDILYNHINVIWQNDADSKYCSRHAIDKMNEILQEPIESGE